MTTRDDCLALDAQDPLRPLRDRFILPPGTIYLDGNSLGVLPASAPARIAHVVAQEWGADLIQSWNSAGWIELPQRVGDKIARLVGAGAGELVVADSTSVNLFKVLTAALAMQREDAPRRRVIVSEASNFPTDLYIADAVARAQGCELVLVEHEAIGPRLADDVALLMLTHVNYRTGRMHDMQALSRQAHDAGALAVWDLAHSAGAVPLDLTGTQSDFAVGCGYKYLNGGPGAPAFVWVKPTHAERFSQPLAGWMGHAAPFAFNTAYRPAAGIRRYLCGTPPVLSLAALECGVDSVLAAEAFGGMPALRAKSLALTDLFIELILQRCAGLGLTLITPTDHAQRGSQVCLACDEGAYAIVQALIARGVIGDFREGDPDRLDSAPDILRFGFTPLYLRHVDVWDAVEQLRQVLGSGAWRDARFSQRAAVT